MTEMKKNLNLTRRLALTGAFAALVIVLGITKLGFITLGPTVSITILHVPVILICLLAGLPEGLFVGATFGILSLIQASMNPSTLLDPLFVNPLFSVVPRMLVAVVAWGLWTLFSNVSKLRKENIIGITALFFGIFYICFTNILPTHLGIGLTLLSTAVIWLVLVNASKVPLTVFAGLTGFLSTLAHTLLVIGFIYLFKGAYIREALGGVGYFGFIAMLGMNVIFEALAATIICVAVYAGLFIAGNRKSKLSQEE